MTKEYLRGGGCTHSIFDNFVLDQLAIQGVHIDKFGHMKIVHYIFAYPRRQQKQHAHRHAHVPGTVHILVVVRRLQEGKDYEARRRDEESRHDEAEPTLAAGVAAPTFIPSVTLWCDRKEMIINLTN